jgi:hypothetical protein
MSESNEKDELVVVYAGNLIDVEFAKTVLDAEGIPCFVQNQNMGTLMPWAVSPAGLSSVQLVIRAGDAERVRPIIEDIQKGESGGENREQ